MSGGFWDYEEHGLYAGLERVVRFTDGGNIKKDFPQLYKHLKTLADELPEILHEIDYHYSGDSSIDDLKGFDQEAINKLTT